MKPTHLNEKSFTTFSQIFSMSYLAQTTGIYNSTLKSKKFVSDSTNKTLTFEHGLGSINQRRPEVMWCSTKHRVSFLVFNINISPMPYQQKSNLQVLIFFLYFMSVYASNIFINLVPLFIWVIRVHSVFICPDATIVKIINQIIYITHSNSTEMSLGSSIDYLPTK